jgi:hypothetical protein
MSVAQSFGIFVPSVMAARMIEVPSGTLIGLPSTVSLTIFSALERGVPKSISWASAMAFSFIRRLAGAALGRRNLRENTQARSSPDTA